MGGVAQEANLAVVVSGRGEVVVERPADGFSPLGIRLAMYFMVFLVQNYIKPFE